jgi:2-keto-myo-inositol isomerase
MMSFALNHMTVPSLTMTQAFGLARDLGMSGVELRNDLATPMFDGQDPNPDMAADLNILALAEVKAFNAFDDSVFDAAVALMNQAEACVATAIALIPQVGGDPISPNGLRAAMTALGPQLEARGLVGLIEPIGFESSTLRFKSLVVDLINELDMSAQFGLIHDTFHHHLAGEASVYPMHTKVVHISGVTDSALDSGDMCDHHRVLVDRADRLGNVAQISELLLGGYCGPFSFEAFSPVVHADIDRKASLSRSITFIENEVMARAA